MPKILQTNNTALLSLLNKEIQEYHHSIQPNIFKPYHPEDIKLFFDMTLQHPMNAAFVVMDKDEAVGYILLNIIETKENPFQFARRYLLIDQILVLKSHRKKGIGNLLVNHAIEFAKIHHIPTIELNHWSMNQTARGFFKKLNFEYYNEKMWLYL